MHLYIKNITYTINKKNILNGVDLNIKNSEIIGLFGSNGAGKTTLLNAISGLIKVKTGDIIYNNISIKNTKPHEFSRLGIQRSFQTPRNWQNLSLYDNLLLPYKMKNSSDNEQQEWNEKILGLFKFYNVEYFYDNKNKKVNEFSIGEQRIIELIRIFTTKPKLLLLDEPSVGLQLEKQIILSNHLKIIKKNNAGILLISHNLDFLHKTVDKIAYMKNGKIISISSYEKIINETNIIKTYFGNIKNK